MNFAWFFRFLGAGYNSARTPVLYDAIYGLPKSAIDAWLAHNPELRKLHEIELRQRGDVEEQTRGEKGIAKFSSGRF
jgi:hypothetical protein